MFYDFVESACCELDTFLNYDVNLLFNIDFAKYSCDMFVGVQAPNITSTVSVLEELFNDTESFRGKPTEF